MRTRRMLFGAVLVVLLLVGALCPTPVHADNSEEIFFEYKCTAEGIRWSQPVAGYESGVSLIYGSGFAWDPPIVRVSWDFGDGATGSGASTTHTWPNACRYVVTVEIEDATGFTYTVSWPREVYNVLVADGATITSTCDDNYHTHTWDLPALTGRAEAKAHVFGAAPSSAYMEWENADLTHQAEVNWGPAFNAVTGRFNPSSGSDDIFHYFPWGGFDYGMLGSYATHSFRVDAPEQVGGRATFYIEGIRFLWSPYTCSGEVPPSGWSGQPAHVAVQLCAVLEDGKAYGLNGVPLRLAGVPDQPEIRTAGDGEVHWDFYQPWGRGYLWVEVWDGGWRPLVDLRGGPVGFSPADLSPERTYKRVVTWWKR